MATTIRAKEKWAEKFAGALAGPLKALGIDDLLKNPKSWLNQDLAAYCAKMDVNKIRAQLIAVMNEMMESKHAIHHQVQEAVAIQDDDSDEANSYSERDVEQCDTAIVFPETITKLQGEIRDLQTRAQDLSRKLDVDKKQQQKDFYDGMAKLPEGFKENIKPEYRVMNDSKQKEFSEMYAEKSEAVDKILDMSKGSLNTSEHQEVLEKAVGYKAELTMIEKMLKREGDENLKPTQVKILSENVAGKYIKQERENHQTARELTKTEQELSTKAQELLVHQHAFAAGYEIPKAPPPPPVAKKVSTPRLER